MTYEEALAFIGNKKWQNSKPGLSRTRELLAHLGNPEQQLKFIHVAGTNGKGSTCAMIDSMLRTAGYRVGLYTSPYIYTFNERFRINGENISNEVLAELVERIRPIAEAMEDAPTEFEIMTAIAMVWFLEQKCDIVVLEVGLGGELDSTNVIPVPEVAVITAIGLDHTAQLGHTIPEIAAAKAGIIKEGSDVVICGKNPEAAAVLERVCEEKHACLHRVEFDTLNPVMGDLHGQVFDYLWFHNLKLPLPGAYQLENAAVALTTIRALNRREGARWFVSDEAIRRGLAATVWCGRMELLHEYPVVLVDGSHNPQGFAATAESLKEYLPDEKVIFLVGVSADKDVKSEMQILIPLAKEFITITHGNTHRAMPAARLAEILREMGDMPVTAAEDIREGCRMALQSAGRSGAVCAIGSLFAVADVSREMKILFEK